MNPHTFLRAGALFLSRFFLWGKSSSPTGVVRCPEAFLVAGQEQVDVPEAYDVRMSGLSLILNKTATFSSLRGIITECLPYLGAPF